MKFNYTDLISGDSIPVEGVGHIRSPILKELKPTQGIGTWNYDLYINILAWGKKEFIKFMQLSTSKNLQALIKDDQLSLFDTITIVEQPRHILKETMAFFIDEVLEWDEKKRVFITKSKDNNAVGCIDRENFDEVRDMMLQVNYINLGRTAQPTKFSNEKSQALWEQAQKHLQKEAKKTTSDKRMQLGNIISKLSCASVGYTLLNIYNLTVFQLYDQFFQYGYFRAVNLSDRAYTNHGGKDFDMEAWLKPIKSFDKE